VPSANATQEDTVADKRQTASTTTDADANADSTTDADSTTTSDTDDGAAELADTGSPNTTPYIVGGTLFLGIGAGFVAYSVRRGRLEAY
jgi:hypothetical protein